MPDLPQGLLLRIAQERAEIVGQMMATPNIAVGVDGQATRGLKAGSGTLEVPFRDIRIGQVRAAQARQAIGSDAGPAWAS